MSDAFDALAGTPASFGGSLELEVQVVNINEGRNEDIVGRCEALHGYVRFVSRVRKHLKAGYALAEAITQAVKDCATEGILADFLVSHSSEVINMLTGEWDINIAKEVWMQEAREDGIEEGIEKGREEAKLEVARSLLDLLDIDTIAQRLKLSAEEVAKLKI